MTEKCNPYETFSKTASKTIQRITGKKCDMKGNNEFKEKIKALRNDETIKRKRWNEIDDIYLIKNFQEGYGVSYIALGLKRTETAVMQRIRTLKLYPQKLRKKSLE